MLKGGTRQMRYRLKKKYFDGVAANQVRTTSPCSSMNDAQWKKLVDMWSSPEHKVMFSSCLDGYKHIGYEVHFRSFESVSRN